MNVQLTANEMNGGLRAAIPSTPDAFQESAWARASLFGLLSSLFRDEPTQSVIKALRASPLRDSMEKVGIHLGDEFYSSDLKQLQETLMVEFSTLFLIPGSFASPYEAVWYPDGSGLLRGPETARVKEYYEGLGFVFDETVPLEPDHISVEFEFLEHLCEVEAKAWMEGKQDQALDSLRYQNDFLQCHLGRWTPKFLKRVENNAEHSFYREVAKMADAFIQNEMSKLPDRIKELAD